MEKIYKLEFYVPKTHLEMVKTAIFDAGAGRIGNYDCCSWETSGVGQYRPLTGSNPYFGAQDRIEKVDEYKVEAVCEEKVINNVIKALLSSHPYEVPAYQLIEVFLVKTP